MKSTGHSFTPMKKMAVGRPEVLNGDQGSQFTSADFVKMLKTAEIAIRSGGKGAWRDNVRSGPLNRGRPSPVPTRPEGQDARGRTITIGLKIRGAAQGWLAAPGMPRLQQCIVSSTTFSMTSRRPTGHAASPWRIRKAMREICRRYESAKHEQ